MLSICYYQVICSIYFVSFGMQFINMVTKHLAKLELLGFQGHRVIEIIFPTNLALLHGFSLHFQRLAKVADKRAKAISVRWHLDIRKNALQVSSTLGNIQVHYCWSVRHFNIYLHYREQGVTRTITECESGPRESKAFMSTTHQIEIAMQNRRTSDTYFLFRYEGM